MAWKRVRKKEETFRVHEEIACPEIRGLDRIKDILEHTHRLCSNFGLWSFSKQSWTNALVEDVAIKTCSSCFWTGSLSITLVFSFSELSLSEKTLKTDLDGFYLCFCTFRGCFQSELFNGRKVSLFQNARYDLTSAFFSMEIFKFQVVHGNVANLYSLTHPRARFSYICRFFRNHTTRYIHSKLLTISVKLR